MKKLLALLKAKGATAEEIKEIEDELEADKAEALETEVAGLKKKRDDLLKENKSLKGEEGGKVTELQETIETLTTENGKLKKQAETAESKRIAAEKERDEKVGTIESAFASTLIDGGLSSALAGKVKPAHLEAVKGLLSRNFAVESDEKGGRKAVAVIKDKDGKDKKVEVVDFVEEWLGGETGKEFALDQGGNGGGARGSGGRTTVDTGKKARFDALNAKKPEELSLSEGLELVSLANDLEVQKPA